MAGKYKLIQSFLEVVTYMVQKSAYTDPRHMPMNVLASGPSNKATIFLGLIEYELNSLLGASHLVDYI